MKAMRYNKKVLEELQDWERVQISLVKHKEQVAKELRELISKHDIVNLECACDTEFLNKNTVWIFYPIK